MVLLIQWFVVRPSAVAITTIFLMWTDWVLTIAQERERKNVHAKHYEVYPESVSEGNPLLQASVAKRAFFNPFHLAISIAVGGVVAIAMLWISQGFRPLYLGYIWGLFLIADTTHISNLIGYRASRTGIHGKIRMHQRTGYLIQMGRYFALTLLVTVIAICVESVFVAGVAISGLTSTIRQFVWIRKLTGKVA